MVYRLPFLLLKIVTHFRGVATGQWRKFGLKSGGTKLYQILMKWGVRHPLQKVGREVRILPPSAAEITLFVCLSVFKDDISKIDAVRIIKLDTPMCHDEFWKTFNFEVKRSTVKVTTSVLVFRQNATLPCT